MGYEVLRLLAGAVGAAGLVMTWTSVVSTLLIPRGRVGPLMRAVDTAVAAVFRALTKSVRDYERRDSILAAQAPVVLLTQLAAWLVVFLASFTALLWPDSPSLGHAAREAVSSLLTLGFATTSGGWSTSVDAVAAATGLVVIALQIAYVPTLYAAFNRRETEVTLLRSRAGEPPWGPELLARTHYGILGVDLATFYASWERWAADIAESHSSYPVLLRFRSPLPMSSWVVALLAVMDAAALQLAVAPSATPVQTRLTLRMGFLCVRQLARSSGLPVDDDPRPDGPLRLTEADFAEAYGRLQAVGYPVERSAAQAWPHFRGWRVNYEAAAYALAAEVDAVPARWSGPRRTGDAPIEPLRPPNRTPQTPDPV